MKKGIYTIFCFLCILFLIGCEPLVIPPQNADVETSVSSETIESKDEEKFLLPDWVGFGMKEGDVRSHFDKSPIESNTNDGQRIIVYSSYYRFGDSRPTVDNEKESGVSFAFSADNQLKYVSYDIRYDLYAKTKDYAETYERIKTVISEKYGECSYDKETWINERFKDDPSMLYKAIEGKEYVRIAIWQVEGFAISMTIHEGRITINYTTDMQELLPL